MPERSDNLVDAVNPVLMMRTRKKQTVLGFCMVSISHHLMQLEHRDDNTEGGKKLQI